MEYTYIICVLLFCLSCLDGVHGAGELQGVEYCPFERFQAKCSPGEVIMITHARYGRMRIGKCIEPGFGAVGCSVDAISFMDKACSGKQICEYVFPNEELYATQPCPRGATSYLEANYECIKVTRVDETSCESGQSQTLPAPHGYIVSSEPPSHISGSEPCPVRLEASPGQQINATVISFHREGNNQHVGFIVDEDIQKSVDIVLSSERKQHIYTSVGHIIDIHIITSEQNSGFLLHYQFIGCADLAIPEHAWHKRSDDLATIGCKHYNKTWQLKCEQSQWMGVVGRCNVSDSGLADKDETTSWFTMRTVAGIPMEIIIIAIIGVVLFISICICVCILGQTIMSKRRQPQLMHPCFNTDTIPVQPGQHGDGGHVMTSSWFCSYPDEKPESPHIWETPLPEPCAVQAEGEYTLPSNMRHEQGKLTQQAATGVSDILQPSSQLLMSSTPAAAEGDYAAPVTINKDEQQHPTAVPPQPMPEYTLPVKKQKQESSHANHAELSAAADDYLVPTKSRPEPIGANIPTDPVFEGSSVKNSGYRPDSALLDSAHGVISETPNS